MENKFILSVMSIVSVAAIVLAVTAFVRVQQIDDTATAGVPTTTELAAVSPTATSNPPTASPTNMPSPTPTESPTAVPSDTVTLIPTETPTPSPTNTPTIADTPTDIPTPTEEPTPTDIPTITPTPTPTVPPADAIVAAPEGFVRLYSGPGTERYDTVATLPNKTTLDVLRTVHNKDDWVKVETNQGTAEAVEGYVNVSSGLIRLNVDLEEIIPIYEYGPKLLEPKRFETRGIDALIEFSWEPVGLPLEKDQFYSVILVRDDLDDADACYHWQTRDTKISFKPEDFGCPAGDYHWGVGLATIMGQDEDGQPIWRDDSQEDERNPIGIGVPHSDKPRDGGGDSSNESGSSSGGSVGGG